MTLTPILMYHETGRPNTDAIASWTVTPDQFSTHLDALESAGYRGVSIREWLEARGRSEQDRMVALTFDDGLAGNIQHAVPLLSARGWSGTFFIITGQMGERGFACADDWRAAAQAGMDVASHTATHPFVATLSVADARRELAYSRKALEDAIQHPVHGLSWPNGDVHRRGHTLLRETGYRWAATSRAAFAAANTNPLDLPRLAVRSWHDADGLLSLLNPAPFRRARLLAACQARRLARSVLGRSLYARVQSRVAGDG